MKNRKILVWSITIISVIVLAYLVFRFLNKATDAQFDRLYALVNTEKLTFFTSMTPEELRKSRKLFKTKFTKSKAEELIEHLASGKPILDVLDDLKKIDTKPNE